MFVCGRTDQLQTVSVSEGGGVVDGTVALVVFQRGRRPALKQEL